ncbi:hypothetical protein [Arthrobacter sp. D1-17]
MTLTSEAQTFIRTVHPLNLLYQDEILPVLHEGHDAAEHSDLSAFEHREPSKEAKPDDF